MVGCPTTSFDLLRGLKTAPCKESRWWFLYPCAFHMNTSCAWKMMDYPNDAPNGIRFWTFTALPYISSWFPLIFQHQPPTNQPSTINWPGPRHICWMKWCALAKQAACTTCGERSSLRACHGHGLELSDGGCLWMRQLTDGCRSNHAHMFLKELGVPLNHPLLAIISRNKLTILGVTYFENPPYVYRCVKIFGNAHVEKPELWWNMWCGGILDL